MGDRFIGDRPLLFLFVIRTKTIVLYVVVLYNCCIHSNTVYKTKTMQVTMFKGLLPVNLPDRWFEQGTEKIKFANIGGAQAIDFRSCGGKALKFWVSHHGSQVQQHWEEVSSPDDVNWGNKPHAIEPRGVVEMFGQSGSSLDLTKL